MMIYFLYEKIWFLMGFNTHLWDNTTHGYDTCRIILRKTAIFLFCNVKMWYFFLMMIEVNHNCIYCCQHCSQRANLTHILMLSIQFQLIWMVSSWNWHHISVTVVKSSTKLAHWRQLISLFEICILYVIHNHLDLDYILFIIHCTQ